MALEHVAILSAEGDGWCEGCGDVHTIDTTEADALLHAAEFFNERWAELLYGRLLTETPRELGAAQVGLMGGFSVHDGQELS